jgi:hypothetical protein
MYPRLIFTVWCTCVDGTTVIPKRWKVSSTKEISLQDFSGLKPMFLGLIETKTCQAAINRDLTGMSIMIQTAVPIVIGIMREAKEIMSMSATDVIGILNKMQLPKAVTLQVTTMANSKKKISLWNLTGIRTLTNDQLFRNPCM